MITPFIGIAYVLSRIFGTCTVAYTLGSIPFGLIIAKLGGLGDIRNTGSGNIGATNVLRSGHKILALATFLCDFGKGIAVVMILRMVYIDAFLYVAALFAVIGHIFPVWLRFHGGKGVATSLGVIVAIDPMVGGTVCAVWLGVFAYERVSSIAALASLWSAPFIAYLFDCEFLELLCMGIGLLITFSHRANIARIMNGSEPSFRT